MKKFTIVILAVTALLLSAFAGSYSQVLGQTANSASVEATTTPETGNPGNAPKDGGERPISDQEKFIIGVFKIEGTDLAVNRGTGSQFDPAVDLNGRIQPTASTHARRHPRSHPGRIRNTGRAGRSFRGNFGTFRPDRNCDDRRSIGSHHQTGTEPGCRKNFHG